MACHDSVGCDGPVKGRQGMNEVRLKLMEAIVRQRVVAARYNGMRLRLAPHLLFERRGDLFVRALNLGKSVRPDDERRLGLFKLSGLGTAELLEETFLPLASYEAVAPHDEDTLLMAV